MKEDERNALLFTATFLQEVKEGKQFVEGIVRRLEDIDGRVAVLEAKA